MFQAYLAQLVPRVLQAQWYRTPVHNLSLEHKDPQGLRGHQEKMELQEGTVNR